MLVARIIAISEYFEYHPRPVPRPIDEASGGCLFFDDVDRGWGKCGESERYCHDSIYGEGCVLLRKSDQIS